MNDVSRETRHLQEHFSATPDLQRYADILVGRGLERGLIGPREVPRIWPRHLANCAVVALQEREAITEGARVADVGSGAGLPGIVWATVRPDLRLTLIEPLLRRANFLSEIVDELGLGNRVEVVRTRAERTEGAFDVVTARAVARLPKLLQWTLPLTRSGGWVVALKGSGAADEVAEARSLLTRMHAGLVDVRTYGADLLVEPTTAVLVERAG